MRYGLLLWGLRRGRRRDGHACRINWITWRAMLLWRADA